MVSAPPVGPCFFSTNPRWVPSRRGSANSTVGSYAKCALQQNTHCNKRGVFFPGIFGCFWEEDRFFWGRICVSGLMFIFRSFCAGFRVIFFLSLSPVLIKFFDTKYCCCSPYVATYQKVSFAFLCILRQRIFYWQLVIARRTLILAGLPKKDFNFFPIGDD